MNPRCSFAGPLRGALVALALVAALPLAGAQSSAKPPPRLPPNPAETSRIPAGVDTGSPTTSNSMQLGLPVPPGGSIDNSTNSAAARAAARPRAGASAPSPAASGPANASANGPDCTANASRTYDEAMSVCNNLSKRSERDRCSRRAGDARQKSCRG